MKLRVVFRIDDSESSEHGPYDFTESPQIGDLVSLNDPLCPLRVVTRAWHPTPDDGLGPVLVCVLEPVPL